MSERMSLNSLTNHKLKISIIIPVYNTKAYLPQAVNSVISQTYKNLEIIIVDDGSTDGCGSICDGYAGKDHRIAVCHTENHGLAAARNYGLDHISDDSQYIAFLDSDDWYEPDAIEQLADEAVNTDADLVCCKYVEEYYNNGGHKNDRNECQKRSVYSGNEILRALYTGSDIGVVAWNKLYKRKLFTDIRYPEGRDYEDIATTYKILARADKAVCISNKLIHYRIRESSIAHSHDLNNMKDYWWAFSKQYEEMNSISEDYGKALLNNCLAAIGRMWRWYAGFSKEEKKNAKELLDSMQAFAEEHRNEVIGSPEITRLNKAWCVCARFRNPVFMRMLYMVNQIYRNKRADKRFR